MFNNLITLVGAYSPERGIWGGMGGSGGAGRVKGGLISISACFWTAIAAVSFLEEGLGGRWAMSSLKFEIFLIFPYFLGFQVLSHSATREAARILSLLY